MSDKIQPNNTQPIEITENAHSLIMKQMSQYLDNCKNEKINCQCSCTLSYDNKEKDYLKQWKFLYQCNSDTNSNQIVNKLTEDLLLGIKEPKVDIYNIKK